MVGLGECVYRACAHVAHVCVCNLRTSCSLCLHVPPYRVNSATWGCCNRLSVPTLSCAVWAVQLCEGVQQGARVLVKGKRCLYSNSVLLAISGHSRRACWTEGALS